MTDLLVLATEGGIPTSNPWSKAAVPLGILIFVGSVYLLLRANLGTRRGYLVMSTSLWGFTFLLSLLWAFGAPGTPPNTGPQNLPGQSIDAYQPIFVPFAPDSTIATERYPGTADHPDGFEAVAEDDRARALADEAGTDVITFFSGFGDDSVYANAIAGTEEFRPFDEDALADDADLAALDPITVSASLGRFPVYAVPLYPTWQPAPLPADAPDDAMPEITVGGDPVAEDQSNVAPVGVEVGDVVVDVEPEVFFAYYDAGAPYFPSLLMSGILAALFFLHLALLWRDESREARERREVTAEVTEERRVEVAATPGA